MAGGADGVVKSEFEDELKVTQEDVDKEPVHEQLEAPRKVDEKRYRNMNFNRNNRRTLYAQVTRHSHKIKDKGGQFETSDWEILLKTSHQVSERLKEVTRNLSDQGYVYSKDERITYKKYLNRILEINAQVTCIVACIKNKENPQSNVEALLSLVEEEVKDSAEPKSDDFERILQETEGGKPDFRLRVHSESDCDVDSPSRMGHSFRDLKHKFDPIPLRSSPLGAIPKTTPTTSSDIGSAFSGTAGSTDALRPPTSSGTLGTPTAGLDATGIAVQNG